MIKLRERILNKFFGDVIEKRIKEAIPATGGGIDSDEHMWRRLTGNPDRDLSPLTQERMIEIAYYLWESNPLANRLIEMTTDYVIGEGIGFEAADEDVKALLSEQWYDPLNYWPIKQESKCRELSLFGEQIWPAYTNEYSGRVRLGYIDPSRVKEIITDPDNDEVPIGMILKSSLISEEKRFRVIYNGIEEDLFRKPTIKDREKFTDGDCFYFKVNSFSSGRRGRSDLLCLSDWLDGYDQFLFNRIERSALINNFNHDVTLEGADANQIQEWLRRSKPPKPGSIRVHNEKEKWAPNVPNLQANDASEEARLFRNHILGGRGFPEHWFGGGGDVNRATAAEMGDPTYKMLSRRQKFFKYCIEYVQEYQIREGLRVGVISETEKTFDHSAVIPEMTNKDLQLIGTSMLSITQSLTMAQSQGWIDKKTALKVFSVVVNMVGVEINPDDLPEIEEKSKDEKTMEAYKDYLGEA